MVGVCFTCMLVCVGVLACAWTCVAVRRWPQVSDPWCSVSFLYTVFLTEARFIVARPAHPWDLPVRPIIQLWELTEHMTLCNFYMCSVRLNWALRLSHKHFTHWAIFLVPRFFFSVFADRVLLYSPGWPWTCNLLTSVSWVLIGMSTILNLRLNDEC